MFQLRNFFSGNLIKVLDELCFDVHLGRTRCGNGRGGGISEVAWEHWFEVYGTLYYNSAGSNQPTTTYGDGLEEKPLLRGRCMYVVGAPRSFSVVKAMQ